MIELQIALQLLGIVALIMLIGVLGYLMYLFGKVNSKIDTVIEMITYYEKFKVVVTDFMAGPGKRYLSTIQTVLSFVVPLLTNRRKFK